VICDTGLRTTSQYTPPPRCYMPLPPSPLLWTNHARDWVPPAPAFKIIATWRRHTTTRDTTGRTVYWDSWVCTVSWLTHHLLPTCYRFPTSHPACTERILGLTLLLLPTPWCCIYDRFCLVVYTTPFPLHTTHFRIYSHTPPRAASCWFVEAVLILHYSDDLHRWVG